MYLPLRTGSGGSFEGDRGQVPSVTWCPYLSNIDESFLFVWKPGGAREPAGPRRSQEGYFWLFWAVLGGFPWFPMVRWCRIRVIKQNGKSHVRVSFLFGIQGAQEGPAGGSEAYFWQFWPFSIGFGVFPLVSDGPMVQDLGN